MSVSVCYSTGAKCQNLPKEFFVSSLEPEQKSEAVHPACSLDAVNASQPKTCLCKCHGLGIIVSRNKEFTAQWWMWMLFPTEQGRHRLTHFRPRCEGDVWGCWGGRKEGRKEGREGGVHCEAWTRTDCFPFCVLLLQFHRMLKTTVSPRHHVVSGHVLLLAIVALWEKEPGRCGLMMVMKY